MRKFLFCLAMLVAGAAFAEDLAQANKLLETKAYPQAMVMLTRLADSGDAAAQLRLGQVYWYGEGTPVDRARADALFAKAAAAGNAEARQAMGLSASRERHLADIALWTKTYDGADLRTAMAACTPPVIPEKSTENDAIKKVHGDMTGWQGCHNDFLKRMEDLLPVGKAIPTEVLDVMNDEEVDHAKTHLSAVYKQVAGEAAKRAEATQGSYARWEAATTAYVNEQNQLAEARQREIRADMEKMYMNRPDRCPGCANTGSTPTPRPPPTRK